MSTKNVPRISQLTFRPLGRFGWASDMLQMALVQCSGVIFRSNGHTVASHHPSAFGEHVQKTAKSACGRKRSEAKSQNQFGNFSSTCIVRSLWVYSSFAIIQFRFYSWKYIRLLPVVWIISFIFPLMRFHCGYAWWSLLRCIVFVIHPKVPQFYSGSA